MEHETFKQSGFGGGCHWCTEAVFASLNGVIEVQQGWIASAEPHNNFSEAVLVKYDSSVISLEILIQAHVSTHAAASEHSMRHKYRSAVYYFNDDDKITADYALRQLSIVLDKPLITQVLPFVTFKANTKDYQQYYYSNPGKPFCKMYIKPKLDLLKQGLKNWCDFNAL